MSLSDYIMTTCVLIDYNMTTYFNDVANDMANDVIHF